jgi:hypothetical protein
MLTCQLQVLNMVFNVVLLLLRGWSCHLPKNTSDLITVQAIQLGFYWSNFFLHPNTSKKTHPLAGTCNFQGLTSSSVTRFPHPEFKLGTAIRMEPEV